MGWYEARIDRGLQVINYFIVAAAVLATAYVSAIGGKHYAVAVIVALSGTALAALAFILRRRQRRYAAEVEPALGEIQARIAKNLSLPSFQVVKPAGREQRDNVIRLAFRLAVLLSAGSAIYAAVH